MRTNLENNLARQLRLFAPTHETVDTTLIGSFVVPADGPMFLFLDGGSSDRTVFLPEIPPQGGLMFAFANTGDSHALNIVDANGVSVVSLIPDQFGLAVCSQYEWKALIGIDPAQNDFIAGLMSDVRVVTGDATVTGSDVTIAIERVAPTATQITLPSIASRDGLPVSVVDYSTSIDEHLITIVPNGAETIMRLSSWTLLSNAQNRASVTLWPSETLNSWYMKP